MRHITINVASKDLNLYPVADVQVGAVGVDKVGFREYIQEGIDDPVGRFFGVGDYTDGLSPSNRKILRSLFVKGLLYDTAAEMFDKASDADVQEFLELIKGSEGKWDFLLQGHHFWEYKVPQKDGSYMLRTSDQDIAEQVRTDYVPGEADIMVNYVFPAPHKHARKPVLRLWATHGQGSGQTFATPINQLEKQMRAFNADVLLIAHHHKLIAAGAVRLDEDPDSETSLMARETRLVASGSWLRGFMPNIVTYAEAGNMVPLATGAPIIQVNRRDDGSFKVRVLV